jgi:hypothetical protein
MNREKIDNVMYFFTLWIAFTAIILKIISITLSLISGN